MTSRNNRNNKKGQKRQPRRKEKGIVMSVPSGDKVIVYSMENKQSSVKWSPPKKHEIKLSWIQAPRSSATWTKKNEETEEIEEHFREVDPFFWRSREFLRNKCIGKLVEYEVFTKPKEGEKENSNKIERHLGNVTIIETKEDLATAALEAGWAIVRVPEKVQEKNPPRYQEMQKLEGEARTNALGVHKEANKKALAEPIRDFNQMAEFKNWRGKKLKGVVEGIINGSMLVITILPSLKTVRVRIAGVQSPNLRKKEIFSREAKFTTERYTMHRNVDVILYSFDRDKKDEETGKQPTSGVFHGEVFLQNSSIGELLLQSGLGKLVEWSAPVDKKEKYAEIQAAAIAAGSRMWSVKENLIMSQQSKAKSSGKSHSFMGRVRSVISGSSLSVEANGGKTYTVTMSSLKVPRLGRDGAAHEPLAWEAREFVRRKLIGKVVKCIVDYTVPERFNEKTKKTLPEKTYYTVEHDKRNIALGLVENGLATVMESFGDRKSRAYNEYLLAQERASSKKLGLHQKKDVLTRHFTNDVSREAKRAKAMYQELAKKGKHTAIVEYVIAGNKLKLKLPEENLLISFILSGCRSNSVPRKPKEGEEPRPIPPFAVEAVEYTRTHIHQRDVTILIDGQDKTGAFKGYLWCKKKNFGLQLVREGLARAVRSKQYESDFAEAEKLARKERLNLWSTYEKKEEKKDKDKEDTGPVKAVVEVTEVVDGSWFYAQIAGDNKGKLEGLMSIIGKEKLDEGTAYSPSKGDLVMAKFSGDGVWYRAKVLSFNPTKGSAKVLYGDYGNVEFASVKDLRRMPAKFNTDVLPFQARECGLAFITPRKLDQDWGEKAAITLKKLVWGKQLLACIEYNQSGVLLLSLWDENKTYINGELVRKGLARVEKRPHRGASKELIKYLRDQEDIAHDGHKGLWVHGDPGSDEED